MNKKRQWKPIFTIILVVFSLIYVAPTMMGGVFPDDWKRLSYGLDLQGGLELRYTVDYKRAIGDNSWKVANLFRDRIIANKAGKIESLDSLTTKELEDGRSEISVERVDFKSVRLTVSGAMAGSLEDIDDEFVDRWVDDKFALSDTADGGVTLVMRHEEAVALQASILEQTMDIIRKRINAFGLVEPDVRRAGEADIDVQLPGVEKSKMSLVRAMIGQTAQLTFRLLEGSG
ncbi:MAG: preprotein translocase subunit SecD, partial [Myxococcota bacterium]